MNGICLCVDRLHAGFIGAYGSTWVQTPALDELAADGVVFDQFHVDSLEIESLYRSCWFGQHALDRSEEAPSLERCLPALVGESGTRTILASDDPRVVSLHGSETFHERFLLPEPLRIEPAQTMEKSHLARSFARIIQKVESLDRPFFLWCHLSTLGRVWDAPWEMRSQYAEADDPDPPNEAVVPSRALETDEDPDLLLGIAQSYGGQVSLLDLCIGALMDSLAEAGIEQDTATALVGLRGLALGEHRYVGPVDDRLDGELVHVPLMFRLPELDTASARCHELVQPPDLYPTWLSLLTQDSTLPRLASADLTPLMRDEGLSWRDRMGLGGLAGRRALRTPAWYLTTGPASQLFAKPDDRWEANDVADRHADVAERLAETLDDYATQLPAGEIDSLDPLDDMLGFGFE